MESEHSFSGDSSGSGSSSGSSDTEDDTLERVNILGQSLELPQDLCEHYSIFKEFFSMKTWNSLEDKHKEHLKKFLPTFEENDEEEKEKTVRMLLNRETFHFTSPLNHFYHNLKQGNYQTDIAKMRIFLMKARARQQRQKIKSYYVKLLPEILLSRERLLDVAKVLPPGPPPRLPELRKRPILKPYYQSPQARAKQRYFDELAAIRSEVGGEESDDDNFPEGPTILPIKRKKQSLMHSPDNNVLGTLGSGDLLVKSSLGSLKNILSVHKARRQYRENHPELITSGITLEDIKQRVAFVNGTKKPMFGSQKPQESPIQKLRRYPKKDSFVKRSVDVKAKAIKIKQENDAADFPMDDKLLSDVTIKREIDSDTEINDFVESMPSERPFNKNDIEIRKSNDLSDVLFNQLQSGLKQEIVTPLQPRSITQPVPIKLEDLDGIDMMALPIELAEECEVANETSNSESECDESLMQTTYSCFFSMVRALFLPRTAHRATIQQLRERCATLMKSPIAPLNTWYTLSDNWCAELDSALEFLCGDNGTHSDDFVPFLQFVPDDDFNKSIYQWIGAGRDCDSNLSRLCDQWIKTRVPTTPKTTSILANNDSPPIRSPTTWVVRPPTNAELADFREQERKRFSVIAKPFTYIQHGYASVVGPWSVRVSACATQASLLRSERPRHATFTALLRDAIARMPNGEGTKQDIITLLKMSQWIMPANDQILVNAVTSALDRLHAAKRDPIVRCDPTTNIWTYLFRHKSEEDWSKPANSRSRARVVLPKIPSSVEPAVSLYKETATPVVAMNLEVASVEEVDDNASNSDVDVEDGGIGNSSSNLSSAQLLIQATKARLQEQKHHFNRHHQQPVLKCQQPVLKCQQPVLKCQQPVLRCQQPVQNRPQSIQNIPQLVQSRPQLIQSRPQPVQSRPQLVPTRPQPVLTRPQSVPTRPQPVPTRPQLVPTLPQPITMRKEVITVPTGVRQTKPKVCEVIKKVGPPTILPISASAVNKPKPKIERAIHIQNQPSNVAVQRPKNITNFTSLSKTPLGTNMRPTLVKQKTPTSVLGTNVTVVTGAQNISLSNTSTQHIVSTPQPQASAKVVQATRSLLLRPSAVPTTVTTAMTPTVNSQVQNRARRGVVRVLSPAANSTGKSLISPRALLQTGPVSQASSPIRRKVAVQTVVSATTTGQSKSITTVVSSQPTAVTASVGTRTVQLANGRTVQLASGQTVQLASGHTLLSSLPLPVRLQSGQTVQLARSKNVQPLPNVQTVQLTGHTVKLPSGQSVQVASQSGQLQLPSGQTVNTLQLGQNVQIPNSVQLTGQTVQLASGQTVQLPSGQTLQLQSGQTVQLSSGQAIQLSSGQTVQLASQIQNQKHVVRETQHVVRSQSTGEKSSQPIVAKLLTNAQGQMISLEGMVGGTRTLQIAGVRPQGPKTLQAVQGVSGMRVVSASGNRVARPLLLTSAKPLHNIILQSDGSTVRVTSSGGTTPTQTIVLGNLTSQSGSTNTSSAPILKLQQAGTNASSSSSGNVNAVRSVVMDGQQLKLVGGKHVLARLLRPANPS